MRSLTADTELTAKFSKAEEYLITFNGNGTNKLSGLFERSVF